MTQWTVACQALLSMGFSRQEYWSGQPFRSPGDLPNPGIEPGSPALQADSLLFEPPKGKTSIAELTDFPAKTGVFCAVQYRSHKPHVTFGGLKYG